MGVIINYVGWSAGLAGCAVIIGTMPMQVWCGKHVGRVSRLFRHSPHHAQQARTLTHCSPPQPHHNRPGAARRC
jgi:hypothetical protein